MPNVILSIQFWRIGMKLYNNNGIVEYVSKSYFCTCKGEYGGVIKRNRLKICLPNRDTWV